MFPASKKALAAACIIAFLLVAGCTQQQPTEKSVAQPTQTVQPTATAAPTVPHEGKWGIYSLDLASGNVALVYNASNEIQASALRLNANGDRLVFAQKVGGSADENTEIFSIGADGSSLQRLTDNSLWDIYPAWSPDGSQVAFLSKRGNDLDLYVMNADGSNQRKLFDSGNNDADPDWAGNTIVFTSNFTVWRLNPDGTQPKQVTSPSDSGRWGTANLPTGDYDPRLSADGTKIVFERLENPDALNGGYNLFTIDSDGTGEKRLTDNGYAQGLASWSHSGAKIAYVVAAIGGQGRYRIYEMNADGAGNLDVTPSYFPAAFLCHSPVFSKDDSKIFFVGQWWE